MRLYFNILILCSFLLLVVTAEFTNVFLIHSITADIKQLNNKIRWKGAYQPSEFYNGMEVVIGCEGTFHKVKTKTTLVSLFWS